MPPTVRVDFFKPSGKWYCDEQVPWNAPVEETEDEPHGWNIHYCFARALAAHLEPRESGDGVRLDDLIAVCTQEEHPHKHAYPVMMPVAHALVLAKDPDAAWYGMGR